MAPNFRGRLDLGGVPHKYLQHEASLLSFPFPSFPARSLFLSPQPPHNTQRGLCGGESAYGVKADRLSSVRWKDILDVHTDRVPLAAYR